jgi:hypothetical protein
MLEARRRRGARLARLALLLLVLCGTACQAHAEAGPRQVRGLILNVQARSIAQAEAITLRADDGREVVLRVDPGVEMPPGHLREHMALGEPVLVTYQQTPDGLLATRIDDA